MKHALNCITGKKCSSASVVDGKLILSFPNALKPVIWQMDLTDARSSALEIHEHNDNNFALTLKTHKGETVDIALFNKQEKAMNGLMSAARALENAHGQIRPATAQDGGANLSRGPKRKARLLPLFLSLCALTILFLVWLNISAQKPGGFAQSSLKTSASSSANVNEPGVPVSADDFLRKR